MTNDAKLDSTQAPERGMRDGAALPWTAGHTCDRLWHSRFCRGQGAAGWCVAGSLATIAIEKIVLAILRRIEERWEPGQEKADESKQETYAYRLGHW